MSNSYKNISFQKLACFVINIAIVFFYSCNLKNKPTSVVSAATPEAVKAGIEILDAGGNAVDAAVAIAFTLAVTEPALSGIGGQIQILVRVPNKEPLLINGTSFAPSNLPESIDKEDLVKHRATTVPTIVKTLYYSWEKYGSGNIEWNELLQPAIEYAYNGYENGEFRYKVLQFKKDELSNDSITRKLFLGRDGSVPDTKHTFKQPILANTLEKISEFGTHDFYSGKIAKLISKDIKENGGWITIEDLKNLPEPKEQKPIKGYYRGYEIYTMPPPGGGWVIIQALNILEQYDPEKLKADSEERLKLIALALQLAHKSRSEDPVKDLINYKKFVKQKTSEQEAKRLLKGETTHFSAVDKNGIVVSVTSSINNYYGSKAANPDLGFLYNDYMNEYKINEPDHPYNLQPKAMPYSSMTPTILMKDGEPVLAIGSPGSERIISAIIQVISLWIDAKISIEEAVTHSRIHVTPDSIVYLESNKFSEEEINDIKSLGFIFGTPSSDIIINKLNPYFGGVHAVAYENNQWTGAADPRRDGTSGYSYNN
ncbi:MAG: gamma-glutamyltransferase family protein [Ignavibacteria bacterium]|nr:gamma-glutamyltransferase family protein [Ignavibacteria bacterium]MBT8381105.1 gamma-glutamyltransferase family protein [Ignavibacteria bacterium]MBT8392141.1 gamma-glutamyltransferase family protein [Ignavibacteria bacterium]NNJ53541.1 gamma-glutamyltransferase family protein [Ignavibacteriaceae bacterium]NNL21413.1 gamma-glutamyltransferase family protein [Ignavibacteriaceae bacterium]